MSDPNNHNLIYFESASMRELYECLDQWQHVHHKRLLSISIQQDGGRYCCIALTNPTEVRIVGPTGNAANVSFEGELIVWNNR